ncbi:MAG TPA: hypothetical protein DCY88_04850 [Cyanobacteria bacterium UBA11372]|nr:hypothetical protein [Cyanobacteria bacterium UBA11372]
MRIRCIANTGESLPSNYIDPARGYKKETEFPLTVGKEYTVYALKQWQGTVWYYICDDNSTYYPIQTPAPLFEMVDNRMSKYWRFKFYNNGLLKIAFQQWFSEPYFYDKLTDQKEEQVLIFDKVKELMDEEALSPDPMLTAIDRSLEMANLSG